MTTAIAFFCGLVFGCGLLLSGMSQPSQVLSFLDITGNWSPNLALVMLGALAVAAPAYRLARQRGRTLLDEPLQLPAAQRIDRRLLAGAALFGIGWGLAGICPGPAVVLLGSASPHGALFLLAMLVGRWTFEQVAKRRSTGD
ncbi:DUF6691 family protein [Pseudomonas sp. EpS/L25]|uniref:DUF6691 family protein n=1 Tax=Pseudomonas sp. EpS/L25 TaxID=1749078 RepID=UPI000743B473|nr:DUF6691 family protein [Pseudomonas sp. EpS/L25]KUM39648.1 hypothetical protein AR540_09985 [Pseudomonas sp. EpS/L25]